MEVIMRKIKKLKTSANNPMFGWTLDYMVGYPVDDGAGLT